jgi:hypothetical protein
MFTAHKELFIQNSTRQLPAISACQRPQVNSHFLLHTQHSYCWEEAALWDVDLPHAHSLAISCEEYL